MILLGLGSNMGDREANIANALDILRAQIRIDKVSSVYESAALLPDDAPEEWDMPYCNLVMAGETLMPPMSLLRWIKQIEIDLGREDVGFWGPRVIDIDILDYNGEIYREPDLILPHPHMLSRDFVMVPLAEIFPQWVHPEEEHTAEELVASWNIE